MPGYELLRKRRTFINSASEIAGCWTLLLASAWQYIETTK